MKSKIILFSVVTTILLTNLGCGKKFAEKIRDKHIIPYVPIYTQIDLNLGGESNLQTPLQPLYISLSRPEGKPLGYNGNGIIVIRLNDTEYACWDATCTNCTDLTSHFTQQDLDKETATCPVCNTEFLLNYGTPSDRSKKIYPLRGYPVTKVGNKLIVKY